MAARNNQTFSEKYTQIWPCIVESRKGKHYALCSICHTDISVKHSGRYDIKTHISSGKHQENLRNASSSHMLQSFLQRNDAPTDDSVIRAECMMASFIVQNNLPVAVADKLSPLISSIMTVCKDNKTAAASFSCRRTKTTHIIKEMARDCKEKIGNIVSTQVFSLATDGSNDRGYENQIYPIVLRYYDKPAGRVLTRLISLKACEGNSTGENIFNLLDAEVRKTSEWRKCVAFCSDNANVMMGMNKGVAGFISRENPDLFITGCTCHLCHLAASKAASELKHASIEELLVDIYFYVDKSSKRSKMLLQFQEQCGVETLKILKHTSTRWLSLANSIERLLKIWEPLVLFFKQECSMTTSKRAKTSKQACIH